MDQEIVKPDKTPRTGTQALSPTGAFLAAAGVTMMTGCMIGAAMVATVWAAAKLFGLPDILMYALMALGAVPVLWATIWSAGRAWHVEQLMARHLDVDTPVFKIGHYFKRG